MPLHFASILFLALQTGAPSAPAPRPDPAQPRVLELPGDVHEPELAIDDAGTVALVCASKQDVFVSVARDGGRTFAAPVRVGSSPHVSVGMRRGPKVALAGDLLCVTVIGGEQGGGKDGDVLAFTSRDRGATWSTAARVNSTPGTAREGLHALAIGPKGELACIWIDLRAAEPAVFGALSADGGRTWSANQRFANPAGARLCPCCSPSLAIDGKGTLHATWRAEIGGARDLVLATSRDGLATPPAPARKLGTSTWKIDLCPMDGGAVRAAGDDVVVAWRSETKILVTTDRTAEREFEVGAGLQPWVAVGQDVHVVWNERNGGKLFVRRLGRGFAGSPAVEVAPEAFDAVVAAPPTRGKGPVLAAFEQPGEGGSRIAIVELFGVR